MPVARPESNDSRIIAHVDMDCFYVQVEQRKRPELRGLPAAVVQYNGWKGGGLIAVGYEARKFGVNRHMRGDEAKESCPEIHLVQVPVARGKADLSIYRAGSEVVSILARKGKCERASIDEVYLDLTDAVEAMLAETPPESLEAIHEEALKSHVLGLQSEGEIDSKENVREWLCRGNADHRDRLLACGALIVADLRMQVLKETEFTCSAGIANNKMLAKLASGMNKPAQQTVVPFSSVRGLLDPLPIKKMKQLGGKLGTALQSDLGVNTVGDLLQFSEEKLQDLYGINTGTWLWNIARGISGEEVQVRLLPMSHGSGKSFPGPRALKTIAAVQHWLNQLSEELNERLCSDLEKNKRTAQTITVHAGAYKSGDSDSQKKFPSKSCSLRYGAAKIQEDAFNLFQAGLREYLGTYGTKTQGSHHSGWGITSLSVSASKIIALPSGTGSILKYFSSECMPSSSSKQTSIDLKESAPLSPSGSESYSELKSTELQIEDDQACLAQQNQDINMINQDSSCPSRILDAQDGFAREDVLVLPSGAESYSGLNQSNTQGESSLDNCRTKPILHISGQQKRKGTPLKEKRGTILKFLRSSNPCCSSTQANAVTVQGSETKNDSYKESNCHIELPGASLLEEPRENNSGHSSDHHAEREVWNYRIDEIDPSVIDELPVEMQKEIRAWLRPQKRLNTAKRGSSIAHYFSQAKDS